MDHGASAPDIEAQLSAAVGDRYRVERRLGAGGMAVVFLAQDLRHRRPVAIKVLRPALAAIVGAARFLQEIEITAGLQHPNILPLYDSGLAGNLPYYVMPFVAGESLRDRLQRERQLPVETALELVRGIAGALEFAHDHGVVHRDVKPENILLHEGQALVADFGIARAMTLTAGSRLTETGLVVGTPQYMSPEQALGQPVDARTDVYALACLAYEMLAGEPPFSGATAPAILTRQLNDRPPSLTAARPALGEEMDRALVRGLAPVPADRYPSPRRLSEALTAAAARSAPRSPRRRAWIGAGIVAVLLAGVAAAGLLIRGRRPSPPAATSIAVLPFANASADSAVNYVGEGVAEELIGALSKVPGIRVAPRSSSFGLRDEPGGGRAVGARLGVGRVLEGTVRKAGSRLRVTAQLTDVGAGYSIWTDSFDRQDGDALALEEELARAILAKLAPTLSAGGARPAIRRGTTDPAAYDLYLQGRYYFGLRTGPTFVRAGELFEAALARDSTFARAWAGLADSYCIQSNFGQRPAREVCPRSLQAARRALVLDSTLAEAHASLGFVHLFYEWDLDRAEAELRRAIALDPLSGTAYLWLMQMQSARGDTAGAIASIRRAAELEPFSLIIRTRVGTALMRAGRLPEAVAEVRQVLAMDSTYAEAWRSLGLFLVTWGRADSGLAVLRDHQAPIGLVAYAAATAGQRDSARQWLSALSRDPVASRAQALYAAFTAAALGDTEEALEWLGRAATERTPDVVFAWTDPYLEPLRSDPRFARWADAAGVPRPRLAGSR